MDLVSLPAPAGMFGRNGKLQDGTDSGIKNIADKGRREALKFTMTKSSTGRSSSLGMKLPDITIGEEVMITINDNGPKSFPLDTLKSDGIRHVQIRGTYMLANLLQELCLARNSQHRFVILNAGQLNEDPVSRLNRLIKEFFWNNLTRRIDASGIDLAAHDTKTVQSQPRIYIPRGAAEQFAYYSKIAQERPSIHLDVQWLPEGEISAEFIKDLNHKPGILALEMEVLSPKSPTEPKELKGLPFIVPGGRFNELYNWDACFCAFSMLDSHPHIVKSILRHFIFEIKNYGKVLNANRSYYLGRSQPPFLTDLALRTYEATRHESDARDLLMLAILAARKEYLSFWMAEPRHDRSSGLSRYRPIGLGLPPECEPLHFALVLKPYMEKYKMTLEHLTEAYNNGDIHEPDLDRFCLHDRAARESGHDTSNRLQHVAADLATVDLNCLLYRYEVDIAYAIRTVFKDQLKLLKAFCGPGDEAGQVESSDIWDRRARKRKALVNKFMWNEDKGLYFDYNTATREQHGFETVTCLWALWSGIASSQQAALLVERGLPKFECAGGLSSGTENSRGANSASNPQKQWDYPYGWAPHQMLAWDGLKAYGYHEEAERLIYRWLYMVTRVFADYNGTVVEKYDVTEFHSPHEVNAEYGNQGLGFEGVPQEG
ncbi:alpha,alpha-trehalase nth1 [Pseudocyphellaria aurata]|nr:alpha,alpha-trehalase nth1 [Pseudocyphellaria aurata]